MGQPRRRTRLLKDERAALRWFERYLTEGEPRLQHFADITASLAKREPHD
jgi:hypothetical protein